ncbi:O-antigen ligase family protein [Microcoleus sp. FACHB-68]|uniref:O-antigen ligase family protein n=1 Tax=Microcoleus sp. FACHB-68 TaxID=2692826 RepID=UPI00168744A1|nr:O-antigen ligase family protein [Microcoleus sp. FACHB-68]MBD1939975.1 O-antigen ligase family protein [Microcoleus sp. FACHB-68]
MKEILKEPFLLIIILGIAICFILLVYNALAKNSKLAANAEKFLAGFFLFTISGATGASISPFTKLHPSVLYNYNTKMVTVAAQLAIYLTLVFLLSSRLRYTLQNILNIIITLIVKAPFISLFLGVVSFSGFWSDTPEIATKASLAYIGASAVAVYIGKQYSWTELLRLFRWISFVAVIFSIYYAQFKPSIGRHLKGWSGILGHPNQFAFFMALTAVLWFLHALYSPKQRRLSAVVILLALFSLQNANSGASKVLVIVLLSLWFYLNFVKRLPVQWAFISVVLFLIVSIILIIVISDNLESIVVGGLGKDMTLTGRTDFWPQIIDKINQRPLLGYGSASFWQPWRGLDDPGRDIIVIKTQFKPPHSHNGFLDLALQVGWVGLSLFILSFFNNLVKAVTYLTSAKLPEAGLPLVFLTYTIMTNLTETGLFGVTSVWFWYIVLTVRLTLDTNTKKQRETHRIREPSSL